MKATPWTDMVKLLVIFAVAGLSALGARALMTPLLRAAQNDPVAAPTRTTCCAAAWRRSCSPSAGRPSWC